MKKKFYSNGKLLLTGEYAVLDGALALAVPTKYGQSLEIETIKTPELIWNSYNKDKDIWFRATFRLPQIELIEYSDEKTAKTLLNLLVISKKMNPDFLSKNQGFMVHTYIDFPRDWGLGTSSTLVNNLAQWAQIDAFQLLWNALSGSGYDIACAQNDTPILYQLQNSAPIVKKTAFNPTFAHQLYFIHLNQKQSSEAAILEYNKETFSRNEVCDNITEITKQFITCNSIEEFEKLINAHEQLLAITLKRKTIKELLFSDYSGAIKSLGAWGGDFILAAGNEKTPEYFKSKGFNTVISYKEMVL